jgi:hypothetical protein
VRTADALVRLEGKKNFSEEKQTLCVLCAKRNGGSLPFQLQSSADAMRAPSTAACSFAQQIMGSLTRVPSPQSEPAMTFSRPTSLA